MQKANVETICQFETSSISGAKPPTQEPGIVLVNPPYGKRVGNRKNHSPCTDRWVKLCQENLTVGKSVLSQAIQDLLKQLD